MTTSTQTALHNLAAALASSSPDKAVRDAALALKDALLASLGNSGTAPRRRPSPRPKRKSER